MIIVRLSGGLGNQIFQYAFGKAAALRLGCELKVDASWFDRTDERAYGLDALDVPPTIASRKDIASVLFSSAAARLILKNIRQSWKRSSRYVMEKETFHHDDSLPAMDGMYYDGYWQNPGYFSEEWKNIAPAFRRTMKEPGYIDLVRRNHPGRDIVSIQIRGGDYLNNADVGTICSAEYYKEAFDLMKTRTSHPYWIITTDEPEHAKKILEEAGGGLDFEFAPRNLDVPFEDIQNMALCDHFVASNSTFSWWGAWLCENPSKVVIGPKLWHRRFPDRNPIPSEWIKI